MLGGKMEKDKNRLPDNRGQSTRALSVALSIIVFVLALTAGSAWSFDYGRVLGKDPRGAPELKSPSSSSFAAEACLPLLSASHYQGPAAAGNEARPQAGKKVKAVMVLGMVLGARFALSPVDQTGTGPDLSEKTAITPPPPTGNPQVLAVSSYRSCVKEAVLKERSQAQRDL
jgi:hypothetical protein